MDISYMWGAVILPAGSLQSSEEHQTSLHKLGGSGATVSVQPSGTHRRSDCW